MRKTTNRKSATSMLNITPQQELALATRLAQRRVIAMRLMTIELSIVCAVLMAAFVLQILDIINVNVALALAISGMFYLVVAYRRFRRHSLVCKKALERAKDLLAEQERKTVSFHNDPR